MSDSRTSTGKPSDFSDKEKADFAAFVLAGGEVQPAGLAQRIEAAERLIFVFKGDCLTAVAAIKQPSKDYRRKKFKNASAKLDGSEFEYEFGWAFVLPSGRGEGLSKTLIQAALSEIGKKKIFATTREDNARMHATLKKSGFQISGKSFKSERGQYNLVLFTKGDTP